MIILNFAFSSKNTQRNNSVTKKAFEDNSLSNLNVNKNKFLKKYAFISYQYNILSKLKKIESVGTSPMHWFYKEK